MGSFSEMPQELFIKAAKLRFLLETSSSQLQELKVLNFKKSQWISFEPPQSENPPESDE